MKALFNKSIFLYSLSKYFNFSQGQWNVQNILAYHNKISLNLNKEKIVFRKTMIMGVMFSWPNL